MATHPAPFPENSNLNKEHNISVFGFGDRRGNELELNASEKIIALNISYFLNTTFIRYSRPRYLRSDMFAISFRLPL